LKVWLVHDEKALAEGVDKEPLARFVQKNQTGWNLQYTYDEAFCARVVTNEVQIYESHDLKTVWNKIRVEGVVDFAVSPGKSHAIAVFVPERKVRSSYNNDAAQDLILSIGSTRCRTGLQRTRVYHSSFPEEFLQGRQGTIEVE
jgi:uncharacterized protein with WD repeat